MIFPVCLAAPSSEYERMAVRERVRFLSRYARKSLVRSERLWREHHLSDTGLKSSPDAAVPETLSAWLDSGRELPKNADGAPLPVAGIRWSVSHKETYVAGVVSERTVGIDIERIRPVSNDLYGRIAAEDEWRLFEGNVLKADRWKVFFRYWTAKETVLKAAGVGLKGLSGCRVVSVIDADRLVIHYANRQWPVVHHYVNGHIITVYSEGLPVSWKNFTTILMRSN